MKPVLLVVVVVSAAFGAVPPPTNHVVDRLSLAAVVGAQQGWSMVTVHLDRSEQ